MHSLTNTFASNSLSEMTMGRRDQVVSFNHLKNLRRLLFEKHTGTMEFLTHHGNVYLHMSDGYFFSEAGSEAIVDSIRAILNTPVYNFSRKEMMLRGGSIPHVGAEPAVLDACYFHDITSIQIQNFVDYFSRFPLVSIKLAPMHRYDSQFPGFAEYINLYEQSVLEEGVSLKRYLKGSASPQDTYSMIRLLIVLYLFGLMEPVRTRSDNGISLFSRLMDKIRTI